MMRTPLSPLIHTISIAVPADLIHIARERELRTNEQGTMTPCDPRAIANLLLDEADRLGLQVTNLALQKLLYFAHGLHLIQTGDPLVSGYFEAWQYGPVHPVVYKAFKTAGATPINMRASAIDPLTGQPRALDRLTDFSLVRLMQEVLRSYGQMSSGRLVDLSHAKGAPWDFIVDKARTNVAFGLRIPDSVIRDRFRFHKVSIGESPKAGEPSDDTPLA